MGSELPPGPGENRRIGPIERFLAKLTRRRIFAEDEFGTTRQYEILAHVGPTRAEVGFGQSGAFWGLYKEKGDTYFQCGTVRGITTGPGSETITIKNFKVLDAQTGPGTLKEKRLWVKAIVDYMEADGVLIPGLKVKSATCSATTTGDTVPSNDAATAKDFKSKAVYIEVGQWTKTTFMPDKQGNIVLSSCGLGQIEEI